MGDYRPRPLWPFSQFNALPRNKVTRNRSPMLPPPDAASLCENEKLALSQRVRPGSQLALHLYCVHRANFSAFEWWGAAPSTTIPSFPKSSSILKPVPGSVFEYSWSNTKQKPHTVFLTKAFHN